MPPPVYRDVFHLKYHLYTKQGEKKIIMENVLLNLAPPTCTATMYSVNSNKNSLWFMEVYACTYVKWCKCLPSTYADQVWFQPEVSCELSLWIVLLTLLTNISKFLLRTMLTCICLLCRLSDWVTDWLTDWLIDWLTDRWTDRLND